MLVWKSKLINTWKITLCNNFKETFDYACYKIRNKNISLHAPTLARRRISTLLSINMESIEFFLRKQSLSKRDEVLGNLASATFVAKQVTGLTNVPIITQIRVWRYLIIYPHLWIFLSGINVLILTQMLYII